MADWGKILSRGNVQDRRSRGPIAMGGVGLTGILVFMAVNYLLGGNPLDVLTQINTVPIENPSNLTSEEFEGADSYEVFASTVLGSNNEMWTQIFSRMNLTYEEPVLVLFRGATESGCGLSTSEVGPHYCPLDNTIYLDETFFDELTNRFGAQGGDVAEAYVIAHEVGHHVQNQLGIMEESQRSQDNQMSINLELQADCFAGLWASSIKDLGVFEQGEIIEAIDAAAAVGDDRIQTTINGSVNPETWTHGSSEQRKSWFNKGYEEESFGACDTFN